MTWIIGIIGTIGGWILKLIFGDRDKKKLEAEIVSTKKENIELHAKISGQQMEWEVEKEKEQFDEEWKDADKKRRYEMLRRDFGVDDPD